MGRNTWVKMPRKEDRDLPDGFGDDDITDPAHGSLENKSDVPQVERTPLEPRYINIGGKATVWMGKGDRIVIETPGGGAWGTPEEGSKEEEATHVKAWEPRGSFAERAAKQAGF
jgi:5-oxoprolinase (ATP-hydrolysing)